MIGSGTEWLCADAAGYKITNVFKSLRSRLSSTTFPHASLYVGDFNCQHVNWGDNKISPDGESLDTRATSTNLGQFTPKRNSQFLLSPMERRHQPGPGFWECQPGQPTLGQKGSKKLPAVTTLTLSLNATEAQSSCQQQFGEGLKL